MTKPPILRVSLDGLRRRRGAVVRLLLWSVPEALPAAVTGPAVARAVDHGFLSGRPVQGLAWLVPVVVAAVLGGFGTRQVYRCAGAVVEPFRDDLVRRVVSDAVRGAGRDGAPPDPAVVARLTYQVETARDSFAGIVLVTRGFVVTLCGAVAGLVTVAPLVLPLVLVPVLAALTIFLLALRTVAAGQRAYLLADEELARCAAEALGASRDVLACRAQGRVAAMVGARIDAQARAERAVARLTATRTASVALGGWLPVVAILAAAGALARHGLTAGALLGSLACVSQSVRPALGTFAQSVGDSGLRYAVTLERILGSAAGHPPARGIVAEPGGYGMALRKIWFRYGPAAEPVLRELDLDIPEGEHLAIVGPSGVGKSTLAGLLCGTIQPGQGRIWLGGLPLEHLHPAALASARVLIPQEAYVFSGSLGANLTYLRPGADRARLDHAARTLGATALFDRLGGYRAPLTPAQLSAGERQLVALVRAYLSAAPIAVLDEATCHLDPSAEERVERGFAARTVAGRPGTLIVIAHRISSATRAQLVLVLDGKEAALGSHRELLSRSALYRELTGHWLTPSATTS